MIVNRSKVFSSLLAGLATFSTLFAGNPKVVQPIQFNHQYHIDEIELECYDCHLQVETQRRASIPNIYQCAECHEDMDTDIEEAQKVVDHISEGKKIPWIQVHRVTDHAYFSHQRHVTLGEIDCSTCHGNVAERTEPFTEPYVEITMDWCKSCHKGNLVTQDCNACHR